MKIPVELRDLVYHSVKLLGHAIQDVYGLVLFNQIESLRLQMKKVRQKEGDIVHAALEDVYKRMSKRHDEDLHRIAKAFSLMLEIINACETAYRTHRLQEFKLEVQKKPDSLIYVFTSHPTEARSREFLFLSDRVEELLIKALDSGFEEVSEKLLHLFRLALKIPLANNKRPEVKDEAQQILHTVLDESILSEQIYLRKNGVNVYFRTWVGGDKDGHPKVGPLTLVQTMTQSRGRLLDYMQKRIDEFQSELKLFNLTDVKVASELKILQQVMLALKKVNRGDGKRVAGLKKQFQKILKKQPKSPQLQEIHELVRLYPALVLPMEIREDSSLIHQALSGPQTISLMLKTLKEISSGLDPKFYVRGFIISMCQGPQDLLAAIKLIVKYLGSYAIPAVPLLENEQGLNHGVEILTKTFAEFPMIQEHKKRWDGKLEVMLGYSDSSKENGVLPSRLLVEKALLDLEKLLLREKLTPVFFHGSGGSTGRGGGSLKEQIAWWPQSALNIYKMTIQGETIHRHFSQAPILRSQVAKIVEEFANHRPQKFERPKVADEFADFIQTAYQTLVTDPDFQQMTSEATPYDFLNLLRIGSRPTKRSGKGKFSLRAIPWILCWTQTRLLLPIWWGVGEAWKQLTPKDQVALRKYYKTSPLMQSYVKNLGFTLARIEMGVWEFHLNHANLTQQKKKYWKNKIRDEHAATVGFFQEISEQQDFTWFQPRLGESIIFRSSMIHPLNVLQKISLERQDHVLLRETVTGIACGMLTTG